MRLLRFFLLLFPIVLLAACGNDSSPGPRIDFISRAGLLTLSRLAGAADTLSTQVFAEAEDGTQLRRFTIETTYEYIEYQGQPLRSFKDSARVYLDTAITGSSLVWTNRFNAHTLAGRETWIYRVVDSEGRTATRSYRLTVRPADSARAWHNYSARLQPAQQRTSRSALAVLRGLVLPTHAVALPTNQPLVDLLFLNYLGRPTLVSPNDAAAEKAPRLNIRNWAAQNRRRTVFGLTTLNADNFNAINSEQGITAAVNAAAPAAGIAVIAQNNVVAFRTADQKDGLLLVRSFTTSSPADILIDVKVRR